MRKRQRKKLIKKRRHEQLRRVRFHTVLGSIFADEIMHTMKKPSCLTGTPEEFMEWDNQRHPYWVRTSWGSLPKQGLLRVEVKDQ